MLSILASALSLATISLAVSLPGPLQRSKNATGPGFIALPMTVVNKNDSTLQKRQDGTTLYNHDGGVSYLVHLSVGTPPQPIYLLLDTGSSETWVDPECSTANTPTQVSECNSYPSYDPYTSTTALDVGYPFYLSYGKGYSEGEYLEDNFLVGAATVVDLQFGWATASANMETGIIAVGFGVEIAGYYCMVDQMYLQGIINSRAFSMDLGGIDSTSGTLVFGGIDTMKYTGPLEKRPIIAPANAPDGNLRYWIYMTSVGITEPGSATSKLYTAPTYEQAVVLDSGSTLSTLPTNLVTAMLADFTGVVSLGSGLYAVDCSQTSLAGTLDFGFGNTIIHVPYHQFIWVSGPGSCIFGAIAADPATYDTWILGDTMLRAAYTVFDQDNANIFVANYVDCGTNIVPIGSGTNAVPSITGACAPTITATSSTSTSSSKTSTSSSIKSTTTSSSSSSKTTSSSTSSVKSTSTSSSSKSSSSSSSSVKSSTTSTSTHSTTSSTSSTSKSSSTSSSVKTTSSSVKTTSSSVKTTSSSVKTTSSSVKTTTSSTSKSTSSSSSIKSTTLVTKTSSTSKSTSSTSASGAVETFGYAYVGCFKDSSPNSLKKILANDSMTVEICLEVAKAAAPPYPYAGVEYGRECWAALTSPAAATPTSGAGACTKTCTGNPTESCGGSGQFNLYYSAPTATTSV